MKDLRAAVYGIMTECAERSAQKFPENIIMSLDLKYLLFLQGIRAVTGGISMRSSTAFRNSPWTYCCSCR